MVAHTSLNVILYVQYKLQIIFFVSLPSFYFAIVAQFSDQLKELKKTRDSDPLRNCGENTLKMSKPSIILSAYYVPLSLCLPGI